MHGVCREVWQVKSGIKPACRKADGTLGGRWRSGMSRLALKRAGYGKRWHIESFFGRLKAHDGLGLDSVRRHKTILGPAVIVTSRSVGKTHHVGGAVLRYGVTRRLSRSI